MEGTISYKQSKFNSYNLCIRMDQAASVMSDPSSALYIKFYPTLNASAVRLPTRAVFVIANSLVVADKALSAKRGYNLRVVETLVGARILAQAVGLGGVRREAGREAAVGVEPTNERFAGACLTTWLRSRGRLILMAVPASRQPHFRGPRPGRPAADARP